MTRSAQRRPRVSVCVPVYNGARYIAECIDSVLAQSFEDFELIVCDNCSTDETQTIARSYRDARVRYVRHAANLGLVGNANRCLELAAGEYVCIFHHDDVMLPENLARKVGVLNAYPRVGFVHSNLFLIDGDGAVVARDIWAEESRRNFIEPGVKVFRDFALRMPYASSIFIGAVLARKACYDALGGFRHELPHCNDGEMWMRMMLFFDVACLGEQLVKYRVHASSTSSAFGNNESVAYLIEHYEAVRLVFERYGGKIPARRQLWKAVSRISASRAVGIAAHDLLRGDWSGGKSALKHALSMDRCIVGAPAFWKAALALLAGREGMDLYRRLTRRELNTTPRTL